MLCELKKMFLIYKAHKEKYILAVTFVQIVVLFIENETLYIIINVPVIGRLVKDQTSANAF